MAFCKYCGTKLEDGQICSCEAAQKEYAAANTAQAPVTLEKEETPVAQVQPAPAPQAAPQPQAVPVQPQMQAGFNQQMNQAQPQFQGQQYQGQYQYQAQPAVTIDTQAAKAAAANVFNNIFAVFRAPVTGGANYVSGANILGSCIFMAIQAIFTSIFACILAGKYNSLLDNTLGGLSYFIDAEDFMVKGGSAFFITFLFSLLTMVVFALFFFVGAKALQLPFNFLQAIDLAGLRAVYTVPVLLVCIILNAIDGGVGLTVFFLTGLLIFIMIVAALIERFAYRKDAVLYMSIIVLVIFVFLMSFIYSRAIYLYVPDGFKELKNFFG